ncbi:MAG: TolC family protein [Bacteroidales bacterium]|nr:TolC family protein [Bacteroidales bacterium]
MKNILFYALMLTFWLNKAVFGQAVDLTLEKAISLGLENNRNLQLAKYDQQIAQKNKWEAVTNFMPRLSFESNWLDNLELNTVLLPGVMFGMPPGTYLPVKFGQQYQWSWAIKAQQVVFSAPLLIAANLASEAQHMSDLTYQKTENDVVATIKNLYFGLLSFNRLLTILDSNISNLRYVQERTIAMYGLGMLQSTDVDQIEVTITNLMNARYSLDRNRELMLNMLRFNLGLDSTQHINIRGELENFIQEDEIEKLLLTPFQPENTPEIQILTSQQNIAKMSLNKEKYDMLPTLSAFYNYTRTGQGNDMRELKWFPSSVLGLSISIPLFAGSQNYTQIQKARIQYEKSLYQTETIKEQLLIQEQQLKYNLKNAYDNYKLQQKNIMLAHKVYKNAVNKYLQGTMSSLDLTQANSNYLNTQNNYVSACLELINAKNNLEKLFNIKTIKP